MDGKTLTMERTFTLTEVQGLLIAQCRHPHWALPFLQAARNVLVYGTPEYALLNRIIDYDCCPIVHRKWSIGPRCENGMFLSQV